MLTCCARFGRAQMLCMRWLCHDVVSGLVFDVSMQRRNLFENAVPKRDWAVPPEMQQVADDIAEKAAAVGLLARPAKRARGAARGSAHMGPGLSGRVLPSVKWISLGVPQAVAVSAHVLSQHCEDGSALHPFCTSLTRASLAVRTAMKRCSFACRFCCVSACRASTILVACFPVVFQLPLTVFAIR